MIPTKYQPGPNAAAHHYARGRRTIAPYISHTAAIAEHQAFLDEYARRAVAAELTRDPTPGEIEAAARRLWEIGSRNLNAPEADPWDLLPEPIREECRTAARAALAGAAQHHAEEAEDA